MRRALALLALALLASGCATPTPQADDHDASNSDSLAPLPTQAPTTNGSDSYAPLLSSPIRGLSADEIHAIETGAGMRLALPAELNGYPGPKHILELADDLGLDHAQRAATQELYDRTNAAARLAGEELLSRWEALDTAFRSGAVDEESLRALVDALDDQQAEVRFIHLRAHLEADGLLTEHQKALYVELRGYGGADHGAHGH